MSLALCLQPRRRQESPQKAGDHLAVLLEALLRVPFVFKFLSWELLGHGLLLSGGGI